MMTLRRRPFVLLLLAILLVAAPTNADYVYESCESQLANVLQSNITVPVFDFTTTWGPPDQDPNFFNSPPKPTTVVTIDFQDAITQHILARSANFTYDYSNSTVFSVSMPFPWCAEDVQVDCGQLLSYGVDKTDLENCTLIDKDKNVWEQSGSGSPYEAGRLMVVLDYASPGCAAGTVTVTFVGVEASSFDGEAGITDYYTWDTEGIDGAVQPPAPIVYEQYQMGSCSFHDGLDIPGSPLPDHMICGPASGQVLRCPAGGHPPGVYYGPTVRPRILCIDTLPGSTVDEGGPPESHIFVRFQPEHPLDNIISEIQVEFGDPEAFNNITNFIGLSQTLPMPDKRAWQVKTPYFNAELGDPRTNLAGNPVSFMVPVSGLLFDASYRTNNHQRITEPMFELGGAFAGEIPPCICGITIQCDVSGEYDDSFPLLSGSGGVDYDPDNIPPIARIKLPPDQPVPGGDGDLNDGFGLPYEFNATMPSPLNGSESSDPDNQPVSPLFHYWEFTGGPEEPPGANLIFDDPFAESPLVNVTGITGSYFVTHYVSDGQDYTATTEELNVVGYPPVIVTEFLFTNLTGNDTLGSNLVIQLNQGFIIDARNSSDPDNYPGIGLNSTFVLNQGPSDPTILGIPLFYGVINFTKTGIYLFTLNVTDTIYFTTRLYSIEVIPVPDPIPTFGQPIEEFDDCETLLQGICLSSTTLCNLVPGVQVTTPGLCDINNGTCCVPINATSPTPSPTPIPTPSPSPVPSVTPAQPVPPPGNNTGGDTGPLYDGYPTPGGVETFVFFIGLAVSLFTGVAIVGLACGLQLPYVRDILPPN